MNNYKKRLLSLILSLQVLLSYGCAKNEECNKDVNHVHLYTSEEGIERYVNCEDESISSYGFTYHKNDECIFLNDDNKDFYTLISGNDLISIKDNEKELNEILEKLKSYYLFEYSDLKYDKYYVERKMYDRVVTDYRLETIKTYDWTTDVNTKNLTGKYTINSYILYGYKITTNLDGDLVLEKSKPARDLQSLIDEGYEYVSVNIYKTVRLEDYSKDIDSESLFIKLDNGEFMEYSFDGTYNDRLSKDEVIEDELVKSYVDLNNPNKEDHYKYYGSIYEAGYDEIDDDCEFRLVKKK